MTRNHWTRATEGATGGTPPRGEPGRTATAYAPSEFCAETKAL